MTKRKVVYSFDGEYDTRNAVSPHCFLEDFNGDLEETKRGIRSFDDFAPATYKKWQIREVEVPDCLEFYEYERHYLDVMSVLSSHKGAAELANSNPVAFRWLALELGASNEQRAATKLLCADLRSSFKRSLKDQVLRWLEEENPRYDSPLSRKQWGALLKYERRY